LVDFRRKHGHCNVPQHYKVNLELGVWVRNQRQKFKDLIGKDALLSADETIQYRVQKLIEIGFDWGTTRFNDAWEKRYVSVNSL
jgi:hypothetical protein